MAKPSKTDDTNVNIEDLINANESPASSTVTAAQKEIAKLEKEQEQKVIVGRLQRAAGDIEMKVRAVRDHRKAGKGVESALQESANALKVYRADPTDSNWEAFTDTL